MQVSDLSQEVGKRAKRKICIKLLKMGLLQALFIPDIIRIRTIQQDLMVMEYAFTFDDRCPLICLAELQEVRPNSLRVQVYLYFDSNMGVSAGMKGADLRHSVTCLDSSLEATLGFSDVPKKAECI